MSGGSSVPHQPTLGRRVEIGTRWYEPVHLDGCGAVAHGTRRDVLGVYEHEPACVRQDGVPVRKHSE